MLFRLTSWKDHWSCSSTRDRPWLVLLQYCLVLTKGELYWFYTPGWVCWSCGCTTQTLKTVVFCGSGGVCQIWENNPDKDVIDLSLETLGMDVLINQLVGLSTTLVQNKINNHWVNCREILYKHSWSQEDVSQGLWWSPPFSSSATVRLTVCYLLFSLCSNNYWIECHEMWHRLLVPPKDES